MLPKKFRSSVTQRFVIWSGVFAVLIALFAVTESLHHHHLKASSARLSAGSAQILDLIRVNARAIETGHAAEMIIENPGLAAHFADHGPDHTKTGHGLEAHGHAPAAAATLAKIRDSLKKLGSFRPKAPDGALRKSAAELNRAISAMHAAATAAATTGTADRAGAARLKEAVATARALAGKIRDQFGTFLQNERKRSAAHTASYQRHMLMLSLIALIALAQLFLFERVWLIVPIKKFATAMISGNRRELSYLVRHAGRQDEIGVLGKALASYRNDMRERHRAARQEREELAIEIDQKKREQEAAEEFRAALSGVLAKLEHHAAGMQTQSQQLASAAAEAETNSRSAAQSTSRTAASVDAVSKSVREMASAIHNIHNQTVRATQIASRASAAIDAANERSALLANSTQAIEQVIELIQTVAEHTNLLALNATIEAARAGEVGRGFAVVASEIKSLANQTAAATGDIRDQLRAIIDASESIGQQMSVVVTSMREMDDIAEIISSATQDQSRATEQIDSNAASSAEIASQLERNIDGVASVVSDASRAAQAVLAVSDDLQRQAAALRKSFDSFNSNTAAGADGGRQSA